VYTHHKSNNYHVSTTHKNLITLQNKAEDELYKSSHTVLKIIVVIITGELGYNVMKGNEYFVSL
jgi:hypothetical protein